MSTTFMQSPQLFFTSESVTEGHPDKVCDQISDGVLDGVLTLDPRARVACESSVCTRHVQVFGEVTAEPSIDSQEIEAIARETIRKIGYDRPELEFDANTCEVDVRLHRQSPDIAQGVNHAADMSDEQIDAIGAGDQGMMIGFACHETPEKMPLPISLAHAICKRLSGARKDGSLPYLRPDGKAQVTVEYRYGRPYRVDTVVVSTQHSDDVDQDQIRTDVIEQIVKAAVSADFLDQETVYKINPTGRFVIGGPHGDAGLTGRKIIVDTYGGMARHGGGAFSGKDPTKVDRSAAYYARYVAKNLVAASLADRLEIQVSYAIGIATPMSVMVESFGTGRIPDEDIRELVDRHFDFRPAAIIRDLDLRKPFYQPTAAYGHFGRHDIEAPWERVDKADKLRATAEARERVAAPA